MDDCNLVLAEDDGEIDAADAVTASEVTIRARAVSENPSTFPFAITRDVGRGSHIRT
jgi:hypothetical protein